MVTAPAALHQCPQILCEGWMDQSWWALAIHHCEHSRKMCNPTERNCTSEYLCRYKIVLGQGSAGGAPAVTYLDHDQRERKDVPLIGIHLNSQVSGQGGEETCNTCMTGAVEEDVRLAGC